MPLNPETGNVYAMINICVIVDSCFSYSFLFDKLSHVITRLISFCCII